MRTTLYVITEQICALVGMTNDNIVEIAHIIKNGDIIAKFQDRPSRNLLYKNKEKLKEKTAKDLGLQEKNLIFIKSHWHLIPKSYPMMFHKNVGKLI